MQNKESNIYETLFRVITVLVLGFIPLSCQTSPNSSTPVSAEQTVFVTATAVPTIEATTIPPTAILTPPALPSNFQTTLLNPLDTPHTYLKDNCQYLKNKWNGFNAKPGTVVMIIMMKGIYKGFVEESGGIDSGDLAKIME